MEYNIKLFFSDANTPDKEKDQSLEVQEVRVEGQEVRVEGQEVRVEGQEAPHQGIEQIDIHIKLMIKRNRAGRVHPCLLSVKKSITKTMAALIQNTGKSVSIKGISK